MSSDIKGKVGWLKDENGEIFIPKTLTSAIQNAEGTNPDNLLKNLSPSPDGNGGASTAIDITYDNATSGITSTNVGFLFIQKSRRTHKQKLTRKLQNYHNQSRMNRYFLI